MKKENGEYKTPKELLEDAKFITGLGAPDSEQGFAYEFAEEVIRLSTSEKALVEANKRLGYKQAELLDKLVRYGAALEAIRKTLDDNCRRAPGLGSDTILAICTIDKISREVLSQHKQQNEKPST